MNANRFNLLCLFSHFPYDYAELPLEITKGISLVERPVIKGLSKEELNFYTFALPELPFNLIDCPNACIRISKEIKNQKQACWLFIFALRLVKPLPIGVSGNCYEDDGLICKSDLNRYKSAINCKGSRLTTENFELYSKEDIQAAALIYQRLCWIRKKKRKFRRLDHFISEFCAITTGQITLYSFVLGALFNALEALFGSPAKGKTLGKRVGNFLKGYFPRSENLESYISQLYDKKRDKQSHGNPDFWAENIKKYRPTVTLKKYSEVLKLHEIVRIAFLGILGWNENKLELLSSKKQGETWDFTQFFLAHKPSDTYLIRQKPYLTHPYKAIKK